MSSTITEFVSAFMELPSEIHESSIKGPCANNVNMVAEQMIFDQLVAVHGRDLEEDGDVCCARHLADQDDRKKELQQK